MKIGAILYNWKTAERIEVGFSLSNRDKLAEITPGRHHARTYYSVARYPIKKNLLVYCCNWVKKVCVSKNFLNKIVNLKAIIFCVVRRKQW